ncbi:MAG: NADH-quinone oxidoreductase subunit J, partial [Thermoguttaceae bacterium]
MLAPNQLLTLTVLLGSLGLWLMLPRGTSRGRGVGMVLAAVALGLGASQMPGIGRWMADAVFWVLAVVTVVSAASAVTFRNPLYCAIWFGQTMLGVAGLFLFTGAQFLAVATVIVYVGAILVTFLFVLMLAQPEGKAIYDRVSWEALVSSATGMVLVGVLSMTIGGVFGSVSMKIAAPTETTLNAGVLASDHVARLGHELYDHHVVVFEAVGVLLLVALIGAVAIV